MATTQYPSDKRRLSTARIIDTVLTLADAGYVNDVQADGKVMTLPATTAGAVFTFRNAGVAATSGPVGSGSNKTIALTISPNSADKIQGVGLTAADNKDLINTKATAQVGDEVTLVGDGTDGWIIEKMTGIWAREA